MGVIKCIVNALANILPQNVVSPIKILRYVHSNRPMYYKSYVCTTNTSTVT